MYLRHLFPAETGAGAGGGKSVCRSANQRPVSRSRDHLQPIGGQYPGLVITISQSETSVQVTWSLSVNQRPVSRSRDYYRSIRGQYPGHVITIGQSEASIQVLWSLSANQRTVSRSSDHSRPIRGQMQLSSWLLSRWAYVYLSVSQ